MNININKGLMAVATVLIIVGAVVTITAYNMENYVYNMEKYYENSQNPALLWLGNSYNNTLHWWFTNQLNTLMDIIYGGIFMMTGGIVLILITKIFLGQGHLHYRQSKENENRRSNTSS
jgi:uncharacterized membrane protein YidH (DUF202 family)